MQCYILRLSTGHSVLNERREIYAVQIKDGTKSASCEQPHTQK